MHLVASVCTQQRGNTLLCGCAGQLLSALHDVRVSQVEVLYGDEPLKDYYTLMDIAYFYEWRRVSARFRPFHFVDEV